MTVTNGVSHLVFSVFTSNASNLSDSDSGFGLNVYCTGLGFLNYSVFGFNFISILRNSETFLYFDKQ